MFQKHVSFYYRQVRFRWVLNANEYCSCIEKNSHIDAFGEVMPCEYIRYSFGNMKVTPLNETLHGARSLHFKKRYGEVYQKLQLCDYYCNTL